VDSMQSHEDSTWSSGVHEFHKVHVESSWTLGIMSEVEMQSSWTPHGLQIESMEMCGGV
jgi:hypothetical protein